MKLKLDLRFKFHNERPIFVKTVWPKIEFIHVSHSRTQQSHSKTLLAPVVFKSKEPLHHKHSAQAAVHDCPDV